MADLTFLMNADPAGSTNKFYTRAKQYFAGTGSTIVEAPSNGQTLEGIFKDLKARPKVPATINLVSHAIGFGAIEGPITLADQAAGRKMTIADDLQDALANKSLAPPGPGIITDKTRIVLYGCDVGRSSNFLKLLAGLFGNPGELLAPRRLSVFKLDGSTVKYRQAQSWTLVRKARLIPAGASIPAGDWPAYRTLFVKDAVDKFDRIAIQTELEGEKRFKEMLDAAASGATDAMAPTFFLEENIDILPTATQTAKQAADSVKPIANGDQVIAIPKSATQVDDTTVVTTISGTDAYPANATKTQYSITIVLLAQVIDEDVPIAEGPGYARVTSSTGLAPSPGPTPTGGGATSGGGASSDPSAFEEDVRALLDELLADGAAQADVDAVLAALPQGDATEDSNAGDSDTADSDTEEPETEDLDTELADASPVPDDLESLALPPLEMV
jgi:hypothetical protein